MTDTATKHFAASLDAWIKRESLTDVQAARHLGLSFVRLQQYLNGSINPKREDVEAVLGKDCTQGKTTMKDTPPPTNYYNRSLATSLTAIKRHDTAASKALGSWCATVLAKDDELLRWIIERSRHTYSTSRRRKLIEKLRWLNAEDYQTTGIRIHGSWNNYWGKDVVNIELSVTNDFRFSLGVPFSAFLSMKGYQAWRESVRAEVLKKLKNDDERDKATYERLKARFGK